jgi:hypothetical protein
MSIQFSDDAMLPLKGQSDPRPARLKPAVFVPIAIALIGVAGILLGALPVRDPVMAISKAEQVDPLVTGAVQLTSDTDRRRVLEMLDR